VNRVVLSFVFFFSLLSLSFFAASAFAQGSATEITMYAGEVGTSQLGFGNSPSSITSPGPTLYLHSNDEVRITLQNAGTMPHSWAIVDAKSSSANVLWNAQIGNNSNPISPGQSGFTSFTVGNQGNFYYVCQVDDHVAYGMWGNVVVEAPIPEFPAPMLFLFATMVAVGLTAYAGRVAMKRPAAS
jgi:FtsP/CotA-like multicopper oxidase with cupredoxin domain